jgi:hypothetical protein
MDGIIAEGQRGALDADDAVAVGDAAVKRDGADEDVVSAAAVNIRANAVTIEDDNFVEQVAGPGLPDLQRGAIRVPRPIFVSPA